MHRVGERELLGDGSIAQVGGQHQAAGGIDARLAAQPMRAGAQMPGDAAAEGRLGDGEIGGDRRHRPLRLRRIAEQGAGTGQPGSLRIALGQRQEQIGQQLLHPTELGQGRGARRRHPFALCRQRPETAIPLPGIRRPAQGLQRGQGRGIAPLSEDRPVEDDESRLPGLAP